MTSATNFHVELARFKSQDYIVFRSQRFFLSPCVIFLNFAHTLHSQNTPYNKKNTDLHEQTLNHNKGFFDARDMFLPNELKGLNTSKDL